MEPTPDNVTLLLEHGGITAVFALGLLWMLRIVGTRLIAAIDKLAERVDQHTAADAVVDARLARIEGVIAGRESLTPVEGVPITQRDSPAGEYGPMRPPRPKTEPGGRR